jgi:amino-acid N-acetyltransferase
MNAVAAVSPVRVLRRRSIAASTAPAIRAASATDADAIHALIAGHQDEGRLLPRNAGEIFVHAHRFVVAVDGDRVVACADLAPLSRTVAEIRSLVVGADARSAGLGQRLVDELVRRAAIAGFEKLCAFTHAPGYFTQLGFSIVPHVWLPEKIETDCRTCSQFRGCGQYAVMMELTRSRQSCVPLGSLHG